MSSQTLRYIEWSARVRCKEHALGGSYSVLLFIGPIPDEEKDWRVSPSLVGMHGVFTGYGYDDYGGASNNNTEEEDVTTEGYVRLNKALIGAGLKSLLPEDVVPFLTNELGWRVQKTSGEVITPETNFLEVMVVSVTLERSAETGFPKPLGPPMQYPECTAGRPGGCSNP